MTAALDPTPMLAMHAALRRELTSLVRLSERTAPDVRIVLSVASGWQLFKMGMHAHESAEEAVLWPALRAALSGRPEALARLEALSAEHAALDPVIAETDAIIDAAVSSDHDPTCRLGALLDALATGLAGHLRHEEEYVVPLIQQVLTAEQWGAFRQAHTEHIAAEAKFLLPWLLADADEVTTAAVLAGFPEETRIAYRDEWLPRTQKIDRWLRG